MKVHYLKLYNMAHLFTFNVLTDFKGSNNYILFNASVTRTRTGTWTTGVTAIALCTSCSRANDKYVNSFKFGVIIKSNSRPSDFN